MSCSYRRPSLLSQHVLTVEPGTYRGEALCRRTLTVTVRGTAHHLVAYFDTQALMYSSMSRPSTSLELADVVPRASLLSQGFTEPVENDDRTAILRVLGT